MKSRRRKLLLASSPGLFNADYSISARGICPALGKGAALMLPRANTEMMQMHLDEISRHVARKAHAVILMAMV